MGISTKDNSLALAFNWNRGKGIWELNASGGLSDGITTLVSNNKFNTGGSVGFKYHRILKVDSIEIDFGEVRKIRNEYTALENELEIFKKEKRAETIGALKKTLKEKQAKVKALEKRKAQLLGRGSVFDDTKDKKYKSDSLILESEIDLLEYQIKKKDSILSAGPPANAISSQEYKRLYLKTEQEKINKYPLLWNDSLEKKKGELKILKQKIKANRFDPSTIEDLQKENENLLQAAKIEVAAAESALTYFSKYGKINKNDEIEKKKRAALDKFSKIKPIKVKMGWISISGNLEGSSFSLFDPELELSEQIKKEEDLIPSLSASYTYYVNREGRGHVGLLGRRIKFFSIGFKVKYGNNLNNISQIEILTSDSLGPTRTKIKTQKVFMGDLKTEIPTGQVFADYYQFVGGTNNLGIHLRGTVDLGPHLPVTSLRAGVLVAALKRDDLQSVANFEIFYGLNNIFQQGQEDNLLSRNVFGIQTTFPFNFKL